ncbi:glutathione S-transferase N-terminal domain-containing protein [Phenylobacterium sp.]|uniref:glutathione S-transferase N-terminal domain-containing protein n=1 Tax=Phenylobacterium sp. TaxID=1871053 RepID=UPI002FC9E1FC
MIDLYTWLTPNGRKVSLMLEEAGLPYRVVPINIGQGEQFGPAFSDLCPNQKIPAIVDHNGPGGAPLSLFESAAILQYLAEKSGQLLPTQPAARWRTLQWLHFQAASLGPMLGQAQHFVHYADVKTPYAIDRYVREARRLYSVLDGVLARSPYLAGDDYSIADVATWPWIRAWKIQGVELASFPHVAQWLALIEGRPAVLRERAVLAEFRREPAVTLDASAREILFGTTADRPARLGKAGG